MDTFDEILPGLYEVPEYIDNRAVDGPLNDTNSYFTGQQRVWLVAYIRQCADILLLNNWTFRLNHGPPADDVYASITMTPGRNLGTIRIENAIFVIDPENARNHITHELIHAILEPATMIVEGDIKPQLAPSAGAMIESAYKRTIEYAVDHLASVVCEWMPLPPWAGEDQATINQLSNKTAQQLWAEKEGDDGG